MLHRRLPRLDLPGEGYFLGCNTEGRRRFFGNPALAQLILDLYVAERERGKILLHGYVVMPDHYHVILSLRGEPSVSALLRRVHSFFLRDSSEITGIKRRFFQRRPYDHVLRDERDFLEKLEYCHNNPITAGLVKEIIDWPWSSFRFWYTGEGPIRCDGWE